MKERLILILVVMFIVFCLANVDAQTRPLPEQLPVFEEDMPIPVKIVIPDSLRSKQIEFYVSSPANATITVFQVVPVMDSTFFVYNLSPQRSYQLLMVAYDKHTFYDNEIRIPATVFQSEPRQYITGKPIFRKK